MNYIELEVERGVPIPPRVHTRRTANKKATQFSFPWDKLRVGDSIFVPRPKDRDPRHHHTNVMAACQSYRLRCRKPVQFVTRQTVKNGVEGVRLWRTQ